MSVTKQSADTIAAKLDQYKSIGLERQLQNHREQLDYFASENSNYTRQITRNLMRMRETSRSIDLISAQIAEDGHSSHLVTQWRELCEHPRLAKASMRGQFLTLTTTDDIRLHSPDRSDTRWLGAFEIRLGLADGEIFLNNLNTRRGGRDHPHVINGNPCFGSNHHAFAQLLANGDLATLFELLVQYLETLNLEDEYGRYGAYWFEQEDVRPESLAEYVDGQVRSGRFEEAA